MPYTVDKNGNTYEEHLSKIGEKTIYSDWYQLMSRLYPNNQFENMNKGGLVGVDFYNAITPYQLIANERFYPTKLPYQDYLNEFDAYIEELEDELIIQFDELQRIYDLNQELYSVDGGLRACQELGIYEGYTNWELIKKDLIKNNDTVNIAAIKAKDAEYVSVEVFNNNVAAKLDRMAFGNKMIATINQLNDEKSITVAQLSALLSNADMQAIMALLQTGSLLTARGAIALLDPLDIPPVAQGDIDLILGELDNYLGL